MAKKKNKKEIWKLVDLGYNYYYGRGRKPIYKMAYECFSRAAKLGNANAMYKLGDMHRHGLYIDKDLNEAFSWYKKAEARPLDCDAEYGEYVAASIALRIGRALLLGEGTAGDILGALSYLQLAEQKYCARILSIRYLKNCEQEPDVASYSEKKLPEVQELLKQTRAEMKRLIAMEIPDGWSRGLVWHILSDYQWDMESQGLSQRTIKRKLSEARKDSEKLHALAACGYGFL